MAPSRKQTNKLSKAAKSHFQAAGNSSANLPAGEEAKKSAEVKPVTGYADPASRDGDRTSETTDYAILANPELNESGVARSIGMDSASGADQSQVPLDDLSRVVVTHPFAGPLLTAAQAVLEVFDGDIGIADNQFWPVVEARRILYGANDGFVAAFDRDRSAAFTTSDIGNQPIIASTEAASFELGGSAHGGTSDIRKESFSISLSDPELEAGIRALGKLMRTSEPVEVNAPVVLDIGRKYMKMKEWGKRHEVCLSTVKYWRRLGLPTNGIEGRGVRVKLPEADNWVHAGGPKLALAAAGAKHARRGGK